MKKIIICIALTALGIISAKSQFYMSAGYNISGIKLTAANRAVFLYNFTRRDWLEKDMPYLGLMHGMKVSAGYSFSKAYVDLGFMLSWNNYRAEGVPPSTGVYGGRTIRVKNHYFFIGAGYYFINKNLIRFSGKVSFDVGGLTFKTRTYDINSKADFIRADNTIQVGLSFSTPLEFRLKRFFSIVLEPFIQVPALNIASDGLQEAINQNSLDTGDNWPLHGGVQVQMKFCFK